MQPEMFKIYSGCFWLLLFVIYYKNPKHHFPKEKSNSLYYGISMKSALQSENHWNYAQKFGIDLGLVICGIFAIISTLVNILYIGNSLSLTAYSTLAFSMSILPIPVFYLFLDYKLKHTIV